MEHCHVSREAVMLEKTIKMFTVDNAEHFAEIKLPSEVILLKT